MASERILVVEDDRPIAELLKYRLIKEGFETEIAETGSKRPGRVPAGDADHAHPHHHGHGAQHGGG